MEISLEKIDMIRERTGVSYKTAKEVLEKHNGDVVEALVELEEKGSSWANNITSKGDELLERIKEVLKEGNVTKITVKKDGEIIMNIPVNAGAVGVLISPLLATFGLTAAVLSKCTIEITKKDGEVIKLEEVAGKAMDKVKQAVKKDNKDGNE
ncbi:hypothetical protein CLPU_3c01150 [Gottschalkia purinilytica]|uniref:DUF4342 domain-containing protein n=1 Tax=Gottschalkia purinilytica TaxID=1503 RepID=A0A0L0WCY6_GOTPU|nr:DUF4342 domain-containing protein [Gottschalkia purinilytica]KNF09337.1 hypothetical protein CLPU_3c01150 [Gottschalkia purinilytica]